MFAGCAVWTIGTWTKFISGGRQRKCDSLRSKSKPFTIIIFDSIFVHEKTVYVWKLPLKLKVFYNIDCDGSGKNLSVGSIPHMDRLGYVSIHYLILTILSVYGQWFFAKRNNNSRSTRRHTHYECTTYMLKCYARTRYCVVVGILSLRSAHNLSRRTTRLQKCIKVVFAS